MSKLGPQIHQQEAYNRVRDAHMLDRPCVLVLPDGTVLQVIVTGAHEVFPGHGSFDTPELTVRCEVKAAYGPGEHDSGIFPTLKEIQ